MGSKNRQNPDIGARVKDTESELRLAIREGHEAMSGIADLIREAKAVMSPRINQAIDEAIQTAINAKIAEFNTWMEGEMERQSTALVKEMKRAREWMMHNLELISIVQTDDGLKANFRTKEL